MYTSKRKYKQDFKNKAFYEKESKIPSMTQPDMVLSLKQLLDNHTRGLQIPTSSLNYSDFTSEIPEFGTLDKIEQQEVIKLISKQNSYYEALQKVQTKNKSKEVVQPLQDDKLQPNQSSTNPSLDAKSSDSEVGTS